MSKPVWILPCLAAAASGAAGWMLMPAASVSPDGKTASANKRPEPPAWLARPVDGLDRLRQLPYGAERDLATIKLLAACTPEQLKEILNDPATRLHERSAAMKQWAETDPTGCFEWYRDLTPFARGQVEGYDNLLAVLFRTWTTKDRDAALKAARSVAHRGEFIEAPWEVMSAVMETDLTAGLRLACDTGSFSSTKNRLTAGLWEKDPGAFVKAAGVLRSSGVWNNYLDEGRLKALQLWHERDPAEALATVSTLPRDDRARLLPELVRLTMESSGPVAAAAMLEAQPAGDVRERASKNLLESWAGTDPIAAIKWMDDHVPSDRAGTMQTIIKAAAASQPELALKIVSGLEPGPMRDRAMVGIADAAQENDGQAAPVLAWILTQPADPSRRTALGKLTSAWVEQAPEQAEAWLKSAAPQDVPDGLAASLVGRQFSKGAAGALTWAQGLPEGQREQAVSAVFFRAGSTSPVGETMTMLNRLPAPQQAGALQAVLYGAAWQEGRITAIAAEMPASIKAAAVRQVEAWSPQMEARQTILDALGK